VGKQREMTMMREMGLSTLPLLKLLLLLAPFDEVKPRQVNASKRPVFDVPFLEFSLRKPQMENLQAVLHLKLFFEYQFSTSAKCKA
jgi:hypothetical protein